MNQQISPDQITSGAHEQQNYASTGCEDKEPFALQVLGESMAPEFPDGCIIVIDPGYPVVNGAYVMIEYRGEYHFRQIQHHGAKRFMVPVNEQFHSEELTGLYQVRGVVTQKNERRIITHYDYPK